MSEAMAQILAQIDILPHDERAAIAHAISFCRSNRKIRTAGKPNGTRSLCPSQRYLRRR